MPRKPTDDGPRRPPPSHRGPSKGAPARAGGTFAERSATGFAKRPGAKAGGKPGEASGFRKVSGKPGARPERPQRGDRPRTGTKTKTTLARPPRADLPEPTLKARERVAKVIARAGLASRREIEEWIAAGRVAVNGQVLDSPAFTVSTSDRIEVDGAPLPEKERTRLFLFHKPRGLVTTTDDPEGRPTVFDVLPAGLPRLVSVGRLDFNTEGLLLLTNDGGLARVLELPETGWLRRYRVRAFGEVTQDQLDKLREGVEIDGMQYGSIEAVLDREQGSNVWITVALREGKKREIRTVLGALGVHVNRLIRLSFGPFQLGELAEGAIEEVKTRVLRDQIGEQLAAIAGVDFAAPLRDYGDAKPAHKEPARKAPVRQEPGRTERPVRQDRVAQDERPARDRFEDRPERGERRGRPERSDRPLREPSNRRKPSIWRAAPEGEDVPKRRLPRRERAAIPPASEDTRPKRRGQTEDRKGRSILVERVGSPAPPPEATSVPAEPARPFIRHGDKPQGERPFKPRGDRPEGDRPFKPRGDRPFRDRSEGGERPFRARSERPEGDRPFKPRGDRPFRDRSEGGERPFRARSERPEGDRPFKPRGDRPFRERGEGGERPFRARSERPEGDRPFKPRGDRPFRDRSEGGERPFRARSERPEGDRPFKPRGDRPFRDRSEGGERPFRARSERPEGDRPFKPRGDRPFRDRSEGGDRPFRARSERPEGDRPFKPRGDRPFRERSEGGERPFRARSERPEGDRPFKPRGERPEGDRSFKPRGDRPGGKFGGNKFGGKPGGRPGGKPGFDKPRGPRRPRPE